MEALVLVMKARQNYRKIALTHRAYKHQVMQYQREYPPSSDEYIWFGLSLPLGDNKWSRNTSLYDYVGAVCRVSKSSPYCNACWDYASSSSSKSSLLLSLFRRNFAVAIAECAFAPSTISLTSPP